MNTFQTFQKAQKARFANMKYYDYDKALKIAKEKGAKKVEFFMAEDRFWTQETLDLEEIKEKKPVALIKGSVWATPMVEIKGKEEECWTKKEQ